MSKAESLSAIQREKEQLILEINRLKSEIEKYEYELRNISIYLSPEEKRDPQEQLAHQARLKFNAKPKEGVEFLIQSGLAEASAGGVAKYLYSAKHLDRQALGDYLGKGDEFNVAVLSEFADQFPFAGASFMGGLRQFMFAFRMCGEGQIVERTMDAFAAAYQRQNPQFPLNAEELSKLCFACMMLQTSLHHPNAKKDKSLNSVEDFCGLLARVNLDKLDRQFVKELFDDIKAKEFVSQAAVGELNDVDKAGFLLKQGGSVKNWKRRYFVLHSNQLYYYTNLPAKGKLKGSIPLQGLAVRESDDGRYCFELLRSDCEGRIKAWKENNSVPVLSKHEVYRLSASSLQEMEEWMEAIRKSIEAQEDSQV